MKVLSRKLGLAGFGAAALAILIVHDRPTLSGAFCGAALLVFAFRVAFVSAPSINKTIPELYRAHRDAPANRPWLGRVLDALGCGLFIASFAAAH